MATSLIVRNLDEELVAKLKRRAAAHGRSMEAEHRELLRVALAGDVEPLPNWPNWQELAAELRRRTAGRQITPSEDLIREDRDER